MQLSNMTFDDEIFYLSVAAEVCVLLSLILKKNGLRAEVKGRHSLSRETVVVRTKYAW